MPSSPSRRAPSSVSSAPSRNSSFARRRGLDDAAALEAQADALADRALVDGGELGELDHALRRVLERRVEELAARHVVVARRRRGRRARRSTASGRCRGRRCAPSRPRRTARRSGCIRSRSRVPVEQARAVDEVLVVARASCPPPGRAPRSGRGSRPTGTRSPVVAALKATYAWRSFWRRSARRDRCRRGCSPSPKIMSQASSSSRVRASLGAIVAEQLLRRLGRPEAVERHLLLVDVREPDERPGAPPCDLHGRAPRPAAARDGVGDDHHLPAGLDAERAVDEEPRVLLDARVYESATYAVLLDDLAVELDPAAVPELLDHVPVDRARVRAADLREARCRSRGGPCPRSSRRTGCSACGAGCPGCSRSRTRRAAARPRRCRACRAGTPRPRRARRRRSCRPRSGGGRRRPRGRGSRPDTPRS